MTPLAVVFGLTAAREVEQIDHVYFRVHGNVLEVLAVWHTPRGSDPVV